MSNFTRNYKKEIYDYLVDKTLKGEEIPNLMGITRELNVINQTASCAMIRLDMEGKIKYKRGKVLWVKVPKAGADRDREIKTVKQQKTYTSEEIRAKYKNAVNELLKNIIDTANDMPSDRKIDLMKSILNITDNLQSKLFED